MELEFEEEYYCVQNDADEERETAGIAEKRRRKEKDEKEEKKEEKEEE